MLLQWTCVVFASHLSSTHQDAAHDFRAIAGHPPRCNCVTMPSASAIEALQRPLLTFSAADMMLFVGQLGEAFRPAVKAVCEGSLDGHRFLQALSTSQLPLTPAQVQAVLVELHAQTQRYKEEGEPLQMREFAKIAQPRTGEFFKMDEDVIIAVECAAVFCSLHGTMSLTVDDDPVDWSVSADGRLTASVRLERGRHMVRMDWCFTGDRLQRADRTSRCESAIRVRGSSVYFVGAATEELAERFFFQTSRSTPTADAEDPCRSEGA